MKFFYEDVLKAVGEFGPWQVRMLFLLWVPIFMCGTQFITTDFMGMEPKELFCKYENCINYSKIFLDGTIKNKLENYSEIFPDTHEYYGEDASELAAALSNAKPFCTINIPLMTNEGFCFWNNVTRIRGETYSCKNGDRFKYPESFKFKTVITEFNLVCQDYPFRLVFSLVSGSGSFVGSIVIAVIADRRGRRPAMLLSMLTMSSGAILETFMQSFPTVFIMTFLNSFGKWALFQICLLYLMEIIGFQKRFRKFYWISYNSVAGISFLIPYCLGKIVATFIVTYYPDWRHFELYIGVGSCIQIPLLWFIPESPRWLLSHHKIEQAKKLLSSIAKVNSENVDIDIKVRKRQKCFELDGAEIKDNILEITFGGPAQKRVLLEQRHYSMKKICVPETVQYTVAFLWCWPMINFLRFGVVEAAQIFENTITTSYYRSCIEILGLIFTCILEGFMGRRCALLTFLNITAVMYFGISIKGIEIATQKAIIYIANFQSISANTLIILYTLSVYPTSLRSITFGFFTAWSSLGEIMAPIFIDYVPYRTNSQETAFFAMGLAALIGACLCYYLPETLGRPLPETMDDVLYLRARNPSCCSRIKYERKTDRCKYVPVKIAPKIKIPNHDTAPTEEIRQWRQQAFGVNHLNNAFNLAEIERQTKLGRE